MILATFRSEEVGREHPLTVTMGDLAGTSGVVRMQLPALSVTGVRQLLGEAGSALDADVIRRPCRIRPGKGRIRPGKGEPGQASRPKKVKNRLASMPSAGVPLAMMGAG